MEWDEEFECIFVEVPQGKTSKSKLIALMAGESRHFCWYLHFGDFLALDDNRRPYDDSAPTWLIQQLRIGVCVCTRARARCEGWLCG